MRIPDSLLSAVGFLCVPDDTGAGDPWVYGGSGFFVMVRDEVDPDHKGHIYFVTARHCVTRAAANGHRLHIRLNRIDGTAEALSVDHEWHLHEDPSVDLAVLYGTPPRQVFSYRYLSQDHFVTSDTVREHGIGPGDDLFVVGLFSQRHGAERNLPIVRSGVIAAMPHEPLFDPITGLAYRSYLAEVRSIWGLSGSPVFLELQPGRVHPEKNSISLARHVRLLGVVRGHWDYSTKQTVGFSPEELRAVNMGMALVTPIDELMNLLMSERFVSERRGNAGDFRDSERA